MSTPRSSISKSISPERSRISDVAHGPETNRRAEPPTMNPMTRPIKRPVRMVKVQEAPQELSAESETVSMGDSASSLSSHSATLGVRQLDRQGVESDSDICSELDRRPDPKKKPESGQGNHATATNRHPHNTVADKTAEEDPDSVAVALNLDTVTAVPFEKKALKDGAESYDPLRASWPGAVAYAGSFMAARVTQFALTATGNPQGAAMAFATVAGLLHIGVEPVVGALREKMGMRSDEDTANYTNYVTSLANYVHSWVRGDEAGMQNARQAARKILVEYHWDCADPNGPMPAAWDEAITMLKAGARGFASNELPFFVFSVVYMLTNPAGLWVRSALLEAVQDKNVAAAGELLMSVVGGLMAGIGTVGVQNAARTALQATGDSPMRRTIKLDRLNRSALEFSYGSLELLKKALKDSLREPGVEATGQADIQAIEDAISEALKEAQQNHKAKTHLAVTICTQLEQLPRGDRKRLLAEVKARLTKAKQPYQMGHAIGEKYLLMVGTRDQDRVLRPDIAKVRRVLARSAANVGGLIAYSAALVHTMNTIAQYGPANELPPANATQAHDFNAFPTTGTQAYLEVGSLGVSLITCWVGARALAPLAELALAPVTGMASSAGSALWSAGAGAVSAVRDYFAPAPITNGPPQEDTPPPDGVQIV